MCKKFDPFDFDSKHDWDNDGEHGILDEVMDDVIREMYFDEMDDVLNPDFDFDDDEEDDDFDFDLDFDKDDWNLITNQVAQADAWATFYI